MSCCICLEPYRRNTNPPLTCNPCGHGVCKPCLLQWRRSGGINGHTCPQCRSRISSTVMNRDLMDIIENNSNQSNNLDSSSTNINVSNHVNTNNTGRTTTNIVDFKHKTNDKKKEIIIDKSQLVVNIIDNSCSMNEPDGKFALHDKNNRNFKMVKGISRWEEASKKICEIAQYNINRNISALYYLMNPLYNNRWKEGEDFVVIDPSKNDYETQLRILKNKMLDKHNIRGSTPLHKITKYIKTSLSSFISDTNIKTYPVCLNIITDGEPNDKRQFENELRYIANNYNIFLVINLCTDNDNTIDYYNDLDTKIGSELGGLDVVDDIEGEQKEIIKAGNTFITYSYDIHVCRMAGCNSVVSDLLDEYILSVFHSNKLVKELLGSPNDLPHWTDRENYIKKVKEYNKKVYNLYYKKETDLINVNKLNNMIYFWEIQEYIKKILDEYPLWIWVSLSILFIILMFSLL